jgi:ABC-type lipoprotein release transport system permease subunit
VWRNRRRSLITLVSIGAGLAAILFGQSLIESIQIQLIEKATGIIIGHVRIEAVGNDDLKFPSKDIKDLKEIDEALAGAPGVEASARRVLFTGLVSGPTNSEGVLVCGVEPEKERRITKIGTYVTEGTFLTGSDRSIVLGDKLARLLDVRLGEKVVVMAQARDGSLGADAFRVGGIYHTGSQSFDAQIVYVPLPRVQQMLAMGDSVNDFIAKVKDVKRVDEIRDAVAAKLARRKDIQVLSWEDVDHELVAIRSYQNALMGIVLGVIFAIVALGILNTLLMSIFERIREFGVLKAIGAKPRTLLQLVLLESLILGSLGAACGVGLGSAMIAWYGKRGLPLPIGEAIAYFMPFDSVIFLRFAWGRHWIAIVTVFATCCGAALVPALRAARLKAAEALRHT